MFTQQPLHFYMEFSVSLSFSEGHAVVTPLASTLPLDFKRACSLVQHLCGLEVGECCYSPREVNEIENEYYRGLSHPKVRRLLDGYKAVLVPRMAIRDILGEVDGKLRYYYVARDRAKDFQAELDRMQVLRDRDTGNRELDRLSVADKE